MSQLLITSSVSITPLSLVLNGQRLLAFDSTASCDKKLESVYRLLDVNYPKFFKMDAQSKLGWLCAEYLMKNNDSIKSIAKQDVALILSNQKSSLDTDLNYLHSLPAETEEFLPSPAIFVYTLPNIVTGEICIRHGFKGENNFLVSEQFNADQLIDYTKALFAEDLCKAALVGWIEVYQEEFRALLVTVESSSNTTSESLFNTAYFNQLYQTLAL